MIVHCWQRAIDSKIGEVYVATADEEIAKVIKDAGGKSILTSKEHKTGSDRIFEAIEKNFSKKPNNIINLQGDMPNIDPSAIKLLDKFMNNNSYQIATLATELNSIKDLENKNIVKVETKKEMQINNFDNALDFFRLKNIMSEDTTPYINLEENFYMEDDEMQLWDNTLMDGLKEIEVEEVIDKVRNYYNTCCDIDGRPPSKIEFNEFIDSL